MAREKCKKENCDKDGISFSDFCGEHSDIEAIVKALNNLEESEYDNLYLEGIVLEEVHIVGIDFNYLEIIDSELHNSSFDDCNFYCNNFLNTSFVECKLTDCVFEEAVEFQSFNFESCHLQNVRFAEVNLNHTGFTQKTKVESCYFENSNIVGGFFHDMEIHGTIFLLCHFNQSSFNECFFNHAHFHKSNIYKAVFDDCSFADSQFKNIENDFDTLDDCITMCLFTNTVIENMKLPDNFARWNGVNEKPSFFYQRMIGNVKEAVQEYALESIGNLSVLNTTLPRLAQLGEPEYEVKRLVSNIYSQFFNLAKEKRDLTAFGKIADYFSRVPKEWLLNVSQFLPSPQELKGESTLRLDFQTIGLSLAQTSNIFRKLDSLEIQFVGEKNRSAQIRDLQVGSIIIEIGSNIETIVLLVYVLVIHGYQGVNLFLDFQKKVRGNKKLKLEIAEKQKALNPPQKQESELEVLQKEKLENEIKLLKLQQFQLLSEMTGIEPEKILDASVLEQAKQLGQTLANEAKQLDLYVNIAEEDNKQTLPPPMPPPDY